MRDSRLDIRTTDEAKATLEQAARFLGTTISAFILESAMEKAMNVLQQAHTIVLTQEGHQRFMDALDNPPAPNKKLKTLFDKYGK